MFLGYSSSHNHGNGEWVPTTLVSSIIGPLSTSMIMGGRVFLGKNMLGMLSLDKQRFIFPATCSLKRLEIKNICNFDTKHDDT